MYASTGSPLSTFEAQSHFLSYASLKRLLAPAEFLRTLVDVRGALAFQGGAIDRVVFVAYLALLIPLWRRSRVEFAWAVAIGVVPAVTVGLTSFVRYAAVLLPLAIVAGEYLARPENHGRRIRVVAFCAGLQVLFFLLHANNYWVG